MELLLILLSLPLLILVLEEEDDLDDDDDDDVDDDDEETMHSDAKYVKKRELTISDIIFVLCSLPTETNRYAYLNPRSIIISLRFLLSLWYLTKSY